GMVIECVNLLERFGDRYRVTWDPAYDPKGVHVKDPWMMQLPCAGRGVTVYPHGGTTLAVEVNHRRGICEKLAALGLTLHQDDDHEKTFLFDVARFDEVAAVIKPRVRHRCHRTPEQRAAFAAQGAARLAALRLEQRHTVSSRPPEQG